MQHRTMRIANIDNMDFEARRYGGFTLIEMAISLMIIGILFTPLLLVYSNFIEEQRVEETYKNIQTVVTRIQSFRTAQGRYPCPALLTVNEDHPNYGREYIEACDGFIEDANGNIEPNETPLIATGTCLQGQDGGGVDDGICVEESVRAEWPPGFDATGYDRVVVGAIPFRALQIEEKMAYDKFGGRLVYAISEPLTNVATNDDRLGGINVQSYLPDGSGNRQSLVQPPGSIGFLVLSHGENQIGAFNLNGNLIQRCQGTTPDVENCNVNFEAGSSIAITQATAAGEPLITMSTDLVATYVYGPYSETQGATGFDDQMIYFTQKKDNLWRRSQANAEDIVDLSPNFVGIGTTQPMAELDIQSPRRNSLMVRGIANPTSNDGGAVFTNQVCHSEAPRNPDTGEILFPDIYCFDIDTFTGNQPNMRCPSGEYAIGMKGEWIEDTGHARCGSGPGMIDCNSLELPRYVPVLDCSSSVTAMCDDREQAVVGFNTDGTLKCENIPDADCDAEDIGPRLCTDHGEEMVGPAVDGFTTAFIASGDCAQYKFTCDNGEWVQTLHRGMCEDLNQSLADLWNDNGLPTDDNMVCGIACDAFGGDGWTDGPDNGDDGTPGYCAEVYLTCPDADGNDTVVIGGDSYGFNFGDTTFDEECVCDEGEFQEEVACTALVPYRNGNYAGDAIRTNRRVDNGDGTCTIEFSQDLDDPQLYASDLASLPDGTVPEPLPAAVGVWDVSSCGCEIPVPNTETEDIGCGPGMTGDLSRERTFNAVTCMWEDGNLIDTCACEGDFIEETEPADCSRGIIVTLPNGHDAVQRDTSDPLSPNFNSATPLEDPGCFQPDEPFTIRYNIVEIPNNINDPTDDICEVDRENPIFPDPDNNRGSCRSRPLQWDAGTSTNTAYNPNDGVLPADGTSCSCEDYVDTQGANYLPCVAAGEIHNCQCR